MTIRIIGIVPVLALLASGCVGSGSQTGLAADPLTLVAEGEAAPVDGEAAGEVAEELADGQTSEPTATVAGGAEPEDVAAMAVQASPKARPPAPANVVVGPQNTGNSARDQAVAEIRAKAAAAEQNEASDFPNVFAAPASSAPEIKSVAEVEKIEEDLGNAGAQAVVDAETNEAFKNRALLLWRLGQTHAQDTAAEIATEGNAAE